MSAQKTRDRGGLPLPSRGLGSLAVLIPVLRRPQNVQPLLDSLYASTENERLDGWTVRPVFICSLGDRHQIEAVLAAGHDPIIEDRDADSRNQYPRKINLAARTCPDEWMLLAADDLRFHEDWLNAAILKHEETGALVIGTQDLGNQLVKQKKHATHSLVHRSYVARGTIDEPGKLLCEQYDHNACDVEFVETAMARGVWAFAEHSVIEHMHPLWHRSVRRDNTYRKGISGSIKDRETLRRRRHLWERAA